MAIEHKSIERCRRELINHGIDELAKLVPGCVNQARATVIQLATEHIDQCKQEESEIVQFWAVEKLTNELIIADLINSQHQLKAECLRARTECAK